MENTIKLAPRFSVKTAGAVGLAAVAALTLGSMAQAGSTGTEFQEAYELMLGWIGGYLGKGIAIAFLIVGLFMGLARQNLFAFGVSIVAAFGLFITPTVLDNILTATVSAETIAVAPAAEVAMLNLAGK